MCGEDLNAGCGYGGSCFPKDVKALLRTAQEDAGMTLRVVQAVEDVNEDQKRVLTNKITAEFGIPVISIVGLSDLLDFAGEHEQLADERQRLQQYRDRYGV